MPDEPSSQFTHFFGKLEPKQKYGQTLALAPIALAVLSGCHGPQSALNPAGKGSAPIVDLTVWLTIGAAIVWFSVIGFAVYAIRLNPSAHNRRRARRLIIGGGAVVPTIVLTVMLSYGLSMMPEQLAPAPDGSQRIHVSGEQWWWRFEYELPSGEFVETANEIWLPLDEPVEFLLNSPDVIHSFWIPSLGRKLDMLPGTETRLALHPLKEGYYRGVCAEFCGESHSLMAFDVKVVPRRDFDAWLERQRSDAVIRSLEQEGARTFTRNGCGACHTVRGTFADGSIGPDLTHFGSRESIGAGLFKNRKDNLEGWLRKTDTLKPGVNMPHYAMLSNAEIGAIADYLLSLK
ncbi:cytochrome c oxidase subunit II [Pelagicoccus sp. SDUM812002]|uniref:cytochrome c oxidase subunit II n=1 Tax=Pelagicoccus sp. SDUM812002 TaxID=3041266 RepID=UPI00280D99CB|nr:cytochrome c oxidase subunit II [Pelagicoccus sp. SDUM812002]MDQ8186560.1 cytochrome c oxidase subunit II [Pelagicoccus sp. SDUM812002]